MKLGWWGWLRWLKLWVLTLMTVVLVSCSHVSEKSPLNYNEHVDLGLVVTTNEENKVIPEINEEGRVDNDEESANTHQVRAPIMALHFGPGLYRTLGYTRFLQQLERKKITVQMVSGSEFGLIIAALYAKYQSSARVEWSVFKLLSELKDRPKPYSKDWRDIVRDFLEKEFNANEIQQLKIPLYVPVYNSGRRQLEVYRRGTLLPKLISIFNLEQSSKHGPYASALIKAVVPWQSLYRLGADMVIVVESLSCGVDFKENDGYLIGFFQGVVSRMGREKSHVNLWGGPRKCYRPLDDLNHQETYFHKVERWSDGFIDEIKKVLETWQNNPQSVVKGKKYEAKDL